MGREIGYRIVLGALIIAILLLKKIHDIVFFFGKWGHLLKLQT